MDRSGVKMVRDIVQFVPLRDFKRQGANFSLVSSTINKSILLPAITPILIDTRL